MNTPSICLNMIVKNEAHIIARCLASVRPFIASWCIVDTGSSDDTKTEIHKALDGIPGTLHSRPWKDFGHNRTEALNLARNNKRDYLLFIDADEILEAPTGFLWPELTADAYELNCRYAGLTYARRALVASHMPWRWVGVLHEYLECDEPHVVGSLPAPSIVVSHDGARARDPSTYLKDIAILQDAVLSAPENSRNVFYLAQSYRDAGQLDRSLTTYQHRATMGGWYEEVWYSLFQVAVLKERLGHQPMDIANAYLKAFNARPSRAEPIVELARFHRLRGEHGIAYLYASHAAKMYMPTDRLFVSEAAHLWRPLDELMINAFYVGTPESMDEGKRAYRTLMSVRYKLPASETDRIKNNYKFYEQLVGGKLS